MTSQPSAATELSTDSFIAGSWQASSGRREALARVSPLRDDISLPALADVSGEQVDRAVAAARTAAGRWRHSSPRDRSQLLAALAGALDDHRSAISEAMVLEVGKSPADALAEIDNAINVMGFFAGSPWRESGSTYETGRPRTSVYTARAPLGVVAAITPWNFPVNLSVIKLAPAVAAGNAVIVKPAPETAATAAALMSAFASCDLPDGLLTLLQGGGEVGAALTAHEDVDGVAFTGSTSVGLQVAGAAAARNKRFLGEMGGKNAVAIMNDADIEAAVDACIRGAFGMAGQKCTATSRVLVQRDRFEEVRSLLLDRLPKVTVGDPRRSGVTMGPVISAPVAEQLKTLQRDLREEGMEVVLPGQVDAELPGSCYVLPALVFGAPVDSPLDRDELFGPVLAVRAVDDVEEAIERVNETPFGLVASVFTASQGHRFIDGVDCGTVMVNQPTSGLDFHVPFGGWKGSGNGAMEQGDQSLAAFSRTKAGYVSW